MMTLINAIFDHIDWVLVGAVGTLVLEMCGLLIGNVVDIIRDHLTDYDDESEVR